MANQNTYYPKAWNALCDVCGFKKKSFELRKRWDGMYCCPTCWEARHPQDFLRARKETSNRLPWSRPEGCHGGATGGGGTSVNGTPFPPTYTIDVYVVDGWVADNENGVPYFYESVS